MTNQTPEKQQAENIFENFYLEAKGVITDSFSDATEEDKRNFTVSYLTQGLKNTAGNVSPETMNELYTLFADWVEATENSQHSEELETIELSDAAYIASTEHEPLNILIREEEKKLAMHI